MAGVRFQIRNLEQLRRDLEALQTNGERAISATVKDLKSRAPSWIAQEVVKIYNIKKAEITPSKDNSRRTAGSIRVTGETIEDLAIIYKGRLLTPVHFGMTPKVPPAGKRYTIKATILKGQKKTIGKYLTTRTKGGPYSERSHNILMSTGASEGGTPYIPFQRMSKDRNDIKKFTTVSVPQMVANPQVSAAIIDRLNEEASKRLEHNIERYMNR